MLLEKRKENGTSLVGRALDGIDPREIQIRLIECRRHADAFFETGDRFVPPLRAQVKYSQIVQRFGISGTKLQRLLQILVGTIAVVDLRKDHAQDCSSPPDREA